MERTRKTRIYSILYGICLLLLLFGRKKRRIPGLSYWMNLKGNRNLLPLHSIAAEVRILLQSDDPYLLRYAVTNLLGNILLFIPLGLLLPLYFEKMRKLRKTLVCGAVGVFFLEVAQLLSLRGSFDIDDVLLNAIGMAAGYGIYKGKEKRKRRSGRR